jgi:hypothetical protein
MRPTSILAAVRLYRKTPDLKPIPARMARYDRDSKRVPRIIGDHVFQLFAVSAKEKEYEAVAPENWRKQFGGIHRVTIQALVGGIGHWANKAGYRGDIAYFFETGDEDEAEVSDAFRKLYDKPDQRRHCRMASTPIGVPKGSARGLEVADFLAWHWNKYYVDTLSTHPPRDTRKDISALIKSMRWPIRKSTSP